MTVLAGTAVLLLGAGAPAGDAAATRVLPPEQPWAGRSLSLMADDSDPWVTPAERTGLLATPGYEETMAWLRRLAEASPDLSLVSLGRSYEGRDIWMAVASRGGAATPAEVRAAGRPVVLAHAGIHSGEIDGKDAGLMLLRDLTVGDKAGLLESVTFLFVPILSVDGHERSSPYGRINQRGPVETGWRTNARNQNLNRDFSKLDTPEVRALVRAFGDWNPDLYVDIHVTDGMDYQYDITYGYNRSHAWSPEGARWIETVLDPALQADLEAMGHVPGPLIFAVNGADPKRGIVQWTAGPRFSNGYGDARHLPTLLVENHSLKSYPRRVLGTYVLLESVLRTVGRDGEALRKATALDRARRPERVPVAWSNRPSGVVTGKYLGIRLRTEPSPITGQRRLVWTGEPTTLTVPWHSGARVATSVARPAAYWIPPAYPEVIERLTLHGIHLERIETPRELSVEMYRIEDPQFDDAPYEGHLRVSGTPRLERRTEVFPPGSVRVSTDQPLGHLAMLLLEPESPDSFFRWGFFLEILQRAEYVESYVMDPMAERMLAEDPELRAAFEARLEADPEFAADERARLQWFYRRTPFFDQRWRLYPVAREAAP